MKFERSCGVLLHITSLPGRFGTGTLGPEAWEAAAQLHAGGQSYWQVLPIGPVMTALGSSPYSSPSTFAGNPLLISLELLEGRSWFSARLDGRDFPAGDFCDFAAAEAFKMPLLRQACDAFFHSAAPAEREEFAAFCSRASFWLDDYALFAALAEHFGTNRWLDWDDAVARRDPQAVAAWRDRLRDAVRFQTFLQFLFFRQWQALKDRCAGLGIGIIGDIPIYVNFDSADTWAHPDIFQLDAETRRPLAVSGVPPDYFSATGQLWGNPLYRWLAPDKKLCGPTLAWWARRLRHLSRLFDVTRIDHFRGFESYWSVPAGQATAERGEWKKGPGLPFFKHLRQELGSLPLIAEDLGIITPAVTRLRKALRMPGMKILQFAFDGSPDNPYLPHTYTDPNCVVYTGTHDNNTTNGWFYGPETGEAMRRRILDYLGVDATHDFHRHAIRLAYGSVADLAVIPAQDILGFGAELRMNTPGTARGNWRWKLLPGRLTDEAMAGLRSLAGLYGRLPRSPGEDGPQEDGGP